MGLLNYFGLAKPQASALSSQEDEDEYFKHDPSTGFVYLNPAAAGVNVNHNTAMTYSACWAATMLIMTAVGSLPLKLFRKMPGGGSQPLPEDPRYSLVHDTPNDDMTAMLFRGSRTAHQVNWGNGFAEIKRNRGGKPIALLPIHPSRIPPDQNIKRGTDGRMVYLVNEDAGTKREIRSENILHIPSPMSDDGIVGKGVITAARLSIGFGLAAERHGSAYFSNGARPGVIIKGAKFRKAEDAEKFREDWLKVHGGASKHGKPAILPPDADVTTLPFNAQDSQFIESRQFSIEDVARWYGVPPHSIGHLLRATNNNIEQQALELRQYTLMRWTIPFEQELNRKLLTAEERKTLEFLHVFEGLERADIQTRTNALKEQFFNGEITLNEWRALENRPGIGPLGDMHWVQSAMVPLEIAAKGPQPSQPVSVPDEPNDEEPEEPTDDGLSALREQFDTLKAEVSSNPTDTELPAKLDRLARSLEEVSNEASRIKEIQKKQSASVLRDIIGQMLSVEINAVKRIAEKPSKFDQRLREFYDKHTVTMTRSLSEPVSVYLLTTADVRPASEVVTMLTQAHVKESQRRLLALCECTADQLSGAVDECVSTWHDERVAVSL